MANISASMSFGGQAVAASDKRGLFLKVFSGEVLKAFERAIKITPFITARTITSGKSAQFPTTGLAAARFFTPGDDLFVDSSAGDGSSTNAYLSKIKQSERVIYIDELLTSACFIDDLDEAMSHYDYRSIFAKGLGTALARHQDNYALYTLVASGYDVGDVASEETPGDALTVIEDADFLSNGASALDTIYDAAQALDEVDIPKEDRFVILNPEGYYSLLKEGIFTIDSAAASNSDARMMFDGGGNDYIGAQLTTVAGMPVIVTNNDTLMGTAHIDEKAGDTVAESAGFRNLATAGNLPSGATGQSGVVQTKVACVVFHKSAAGMVKLRDITMESEYIIERQGTLMVAKLATGMGALRNDAVQLVTDST